MKEGKADKKERSTVFSSLLVLLMLGLLFAVLAWAYLAPGTEPVSLAREVDAALNQSGVDSRVTAVLLNFRAYDTLLECFVLFLGVVAVWSLRPSRYDRPEQEGGIILASLVRLLVPLMILVGGYLLWAGSRQAGGAFQSGAILGGAGVLLILCASPLVDRLPRSLLAVGLCLGPLFFLLVGIIAVVMGGNFLEYRQLAATKNIVILESVAAFSIGLCLAALFGGRRPGKPQGKVEEGGG